MAGAPCQPPSLTRRRFLAAVPAGALAAALLAACSGDDDDDGAAESAVPADAGGLTPDCAAPADPTEPNVVGPFFTPDSPERTSLLEDGLEGEPTVLTGRVLDSACHPLASAVLDFWQCDAHGVYDESGSRLRGHQRTDADGRWRLETIRPGVYDQRAPHIHVKVAPAGQPERLTTQLFFPDQPENEPDFLFKPDCVVRPGPDGTATFDFVLDS